VYGQSLSMHDAALDCRSHSTAAGRHAHAGSDPDWLNAVSIESTSMTRMTGGITPSNIFVEPLQAKSKLSWLVSGDKWQRGESVCSVAVTARGCHSEIPSQAWVVSGLPLAQQASTARSQRRRKRDSRRATRSTASSTSTMSLVRRHRRTRRAGTRPTGATTRARTRTSRGTPRRPRSSHQQRSRRTWTSHSSNGCTTMVRYLATLHRSVILTCTLHRSVLLTCTLHHSVILTCTLHHSVILTF